MRVSAAEVWGYLWGNKIALTSFGALLTTSAVKVLPIPGQPFRFYTFFYDWTHQFFNITNTRLSASPVITPPQAQPAKSVVELGRESGGDV